MRLIKIDDIEHSKFYKRTYYTEIIEQFLDSDMTFAEVKDFKCRDAYICAFGIRQALTRLKVSQVKCYSCQGRVIMEKVRFDDEHKD